MALSTYIGAGTNLSSNYYVRSFYSANRDARTTSKRKSMDNTELSLADGLALRRAVKELRSTDLTSTHEIDVRNRIKAYIETYNNALSSASGSSDHALTRSGKQMKSITAEYADQLDKVGITVNKDGSLTSRDSLFNSVDISKFESLFSKDSDYLQRTVACAKKIERRSEVLSLSQKTQQPNNIPGITNNNGTVLPDENIGSHINVVL